MFNMWVSPNGMVKVYRPGTSQPVLTAIDWSAAVNAMRIVFGRQNYIRVKTRRQSVAFHFLLKPEWYGNTYEVA